MPYRALAVKERSKTYLYTDKDLKIFIAVILELAHALSRGRNPSSSCLLPGLNIRTWLQEAYLEISDYGYKDEFGEPCSLSQLVTEDIQWYSMVDSDELRRIIRAISLVGEKLVYPRKLNRGLLGGLYYQEISTCPNLIQGKKPEESLQGDYYDISDDFEEEKGSNLPQILAWIGMELTYDQRMTIEEHLKKGFGVNVYSDNSHMGQRLFTVYSMGELERKIEGVYDHPQSGRQVGHRFV